MAFSFTANAATWNNSSSNSNKDSAAWWAKTTQSGKNGFVCENKISEVYKKRGREIEHVVRDGTIFFLTNGQETNELPSYLDPCMNDETLSHYYSKKLDELRRDSKYIINPSSSPNEFEFDVINSNFLNQQLKHNEILSYLFYKDGKIIHDGLAPQSRFTFSLNEKTEFVSASVGKSFVSYLVGHAICYGYISSTDEMLSSWPLLKNTLYSEIRLIEALNMRARDQHVVTESDGFLKSGRWINPVTIENAVAFELENTKPNEVSKFNYNGFATNVIMNFMRYKIGHDWNSFLDRVFQDKIGISERFVFQKAYGWDEAQGLGWYNAYASKYDYLRIAVSMMEDWQNNTCVGQYLKEVDEKKMPITTDNWFFDLKSKDARNKRQIASHYGGQFYFNYTGMKKRNIIGMDGAGGQSILIDLDNSRVVVVNAVNDNYDWYELVYQPIKTGDLRKK